MKFEITLELLEEMAECIHNCSWSSSDEIYDYMKSCVTGSESYDPDDYIKTNMNTTTIEIRDPKEVIDNDLLNIIKRNTCK